MSVSVDAEWCEVCGHHGHNGLSCGWDPWGEARAVEDTAYQAELDAERDAEVDR
jgi:hypothetical protein